MDELIIREIESQISLDSDLLFKMLGAQQAQGASPGTGRDGRSILENAKRILRDRVCADLRIRELHTATGNTRVQLAAAVLDCIAGAVNGVSPITVSVLLVKEGLGALCKEAWGSGT